MVSPDATMTSGSSSFASATNKPGAANFDDTCYAPRHPEKYTDVDSESTTLLLDLRTKARAAFTELVKPFPLMTSFSERPRVGLNETTGSEAEFSGRVLFKFALSAHDHTLGCDFRSSQRSCGMPVGVVMHTTGGIGIKSKR